MCILTSALPEPRHAARPAIFRQIQVETYQRKKKASLAASGFDFEPNGYAAIDGTADFGYAITGGA